MATTNSPVLKGQCINFGNCNNANTKEIIEINIGEDFICPECEGTLVEIPGKKTFPVWAIITIAGVLLLGVAGYVGYPYVKDFIKSETIPEPVSESEISHPITPENITLDKTSLSFDNPDTSEQLTATIFPDDVPEDKKKVIWQSGDSTVATVANVDENGIVTAVANGSTLISAYTLNGLSATCYVTVGKDVVVTEVKLNKTTLSLKEKATEKLTATVYPEEATNKEANWSSDNPAVATVDSTGLVTAVAEGRTNITVTADGWKTAVCAVTVKKAVKNDSGNSGSSNTGIDRNAKGSVSVFGGSYIGELKNKQPHGMGTIRYNSRTVIRSTPKQSIAEPGYTLSGEFYEGRLVQGKLFNREDNLVEIIIIGDGAHR